MPPRAVLGMIVLALNPSAARPKRTGLQTGGTTHMPIIEVDNLTRRFGDFTAADSVSLSVEAGEIFGFLGPNGAGKSTTINMLCTLLKPTSGSAAINGHDLVSAQHDVRRSIGLVFQDPTLDERLSAWQNLRFHAMLYAMPAEQFEPRAKELLEMVDLSDKAGAKVSAFSGGMKRRLEIAIGLLHRPKVLFLDEPTIGLDPQTRRRIWEYVSAVRDAEGLTVFLTTHYMDEAEICDRIAIIDGGRIVACDTPAALKGAVGRDRVCLWTDGNGMHEAAKVLLAEMGATVLSEPVDGGLALDVSQGDRFLPEAIRALDAKLGAGCVTSATLDRPTLDDVFVRLTGREIRDEGASSGDMLRAAAREHARRA
jgi:ABC-2 type transport system ATP-binding protein